MNCDVYYHIMNFTYHVYFDLEFLYFVVTVRQFYSTNHLVFILFKIFVQNSKPRIVKSSVMFLPPEIILEN